MGSVTFLGIGTEVAGAVAVLEASGVFFGRRLGVERTRIDTFDGRLSAEGLRLERRVEAEGPIASELVLAADHGPPVRLPLASRPGDHPLALDTLPEGPLRARLTAAAAGRALLGQLTLSTVRCTGALRTAAGAPKVLVHVDTDLEISGDPCSIAWAIEVEELTAHPQPAAKLRCALQRRGLSDRPGDVLDLATSVAGIDTRGFRGPPTIRVDRRTPALLGFRAVLRSHGVALDANWDGAGAHLDSEFLHDLRIAIRRTRTILAQSRRVLPPEVRGPYRAAFRWLAGITGPARDLDVHVEGWAELISPLGADDRAALEPIRLHLVELRAAAHAELAAELRSARAAELRAGWRAWLDLDDAEVDGGPAADEQLGVVAAGLLRAAQKRVLAGGRAIGPDAPAADLHQLRKDAKRLRYLLESFGRLGGRSRNAKVVRHLERLQDLLGEHQDAQVQREAVQRAVSGLAGPVSSTTVAAVERIAATLQDRQTAARAAFHDRFASYDTRSVRRELSDLRRRMSR